MTRKNAVMIILVLIMVISSMGIGYIYRDIQEDKKSDSPPYVIQVEPPSVTVNIQTDGEKEPTVLYETRYAYIPAPRQKIEYGDGYIIKTLEGKSIYRREIIWDENIQ